MLNDTALALGLKQKRQVPKSGVAPGAEISYGLTEIITNRLESKL